MRKLFTISATTGAVLAVLACGLGSDPDGEGAQIIEESPNGAPATDVESGAAAGTRQKPLSPGVSFAVGDWTVELDTTNTDADDIVAAENPFNEPPADGRRFVMVEVTVSYTGDDSGQPWLDLGFQFYGSGGNTFGTGLDDYCGVIPNDLSDQGEMFPGASATGNVCVSVPADQIEGGAWIVEESFSLDDNRTFVSIT